MLTYLKILRYLFINLKFIYILKNNKYFILISIKNFIKLKLIDIGEDES